MAPFGQRDRTDDDLLIGEPGLLGGGLWGGFGAGGGGREGTRLRFFDFSSEDYNYELARPEFLNPENFGDDVACALLSSIAKQGGELDDDGVEQEDFGWYFSFSAGGDGFCVVVLALGNGRWRGAIERECGLLLSMLGMRNRKIPVSAKDIVCKALSEMPVSDVLWHEGDG